MNSQGTMLNEKTNPEKLHITIPIILTFGCQVKREVGVVIKKYQKRGFLWLLNCFCVYGSRYCRDLNTPKWIQV